MISVQFDIAIKTQEFNFVQGTNLILQLTMASKYVSNWTPFIPWIFYALQLTSSVQLTICESRLNYFFLEKEHQLKEHFSTPSFIFPRVFRRMKLLNYVPISQYYSAHLNMSNQYLGGGGLLTQRQYFILQNLPPSLFFLFHPNSTEFVTQLLDLFFSDRLTHVALPLLVLKAKWSLGVVIFSLSLQPKQLLQRSSQVMLSLHSDLIYHFFFLLGFVLFTTHLIAVRN